MRILYRKNSIQEEFYTGRILYRKNSIQEEFYTGKNSIPERVKTQEFILFRTPIFGEPSNTKLPFV